MKKLLLFAAVFAALGVLAKRFAPTMQNVDWQKRIEMMPENAPPRWVFRNVNEIRENTDRILALLDRREASGSVQRSA